MTNYLKVKSYIVTIIVIWIQFVHGELYPFGSSNGDTSLTFDNWSTGSHEIALLETIPFMGAGTLSKIWISTFGSISYSEVQDWRLKFISNNIIVAPYFILSQEGSSARIHFRQTNVDNMLFRRISQDIKLSAKSEIDRLFAPNFCFVVTWERLTSLFDSTQVNTFQIVVASNGNRTYAIFNYGDISWTSSNGLYAAAGVFAVGDKSAVCLHELPGSETDEVALLSKTLLAPGVIGRHVFDLTDPLSCTSEFGSPCGVIPKADRGYYQAYFENLGGIYLEWDFYLMFSCKQGFYIKPNVVTQRVQCVYEADYYDYTWEVGTPKCIDLNATRQFQTVVELGNLSATSLQWFNNDGQINVNLISLVEETVIKLLDTIGISGTLTKVDSVENVTTSKNASTNDTVEVKFTTYVPTYTNRKLTNNTLKDRISTGTNQEINLLTFNKDPITVKDVTNKCLQACLCRMRFDPATCSTGRFRPDVQSDACCGDCYGIPYSSLIKACCVDKLYDPRKAVCCNGKIRGGNHCSDT